MTCCGCSRTEPLHSFGPALKPHYLIHFVLSGKGIFKIDGEEYPLEGGCGFLIEPGQNGFYQSDEKEPWTYIWVGFAGMRAEEYVKSMGLSARHPIFHSESSDELYGIVRDMIETIIHLGYPMSCAETGCSIFFCQWWRRALRRHARYSRIRRTSMCAARWNLSSAITAIRSV